MSFSSFFVFLTVLGVSGKPFWPRFGSSWGGLGAILAILGRLGPAKVQFESQVLERSKTSLRGMLVLSRDPAGPQAISSPGGFAPHVRGRPPSGKHLRRYAYGPDRTNRCPKLTSKLHIDLRSCVPGAKIIKESDFDIKSRLAPPKSTEIDEKLKNS